LVLWAKFRVGFVREKGDASWIVIFHEKHVRGCLHKWKILPVACSHLTNAHCCRSLTPCRAEMVLVLYMHGVL